MRGYMRKRGDSWELRVYLGNDPVTGKQRYQSRSVKGGKRDAERVLAQLVAEAERGLTARTVATVGDLLDAWFEFAERDLSPKTAMETRRVIDGRLRPALGTVPLAKLRTADIDRFYRHLLRPGGGRRVDTLSPATVRRAHGILRRALQQGVRWEWIGSNPAAAASPPRVPHRAPTVPAAAELRRILDAAREANPDLAMFVLVAAATGARRSELVGLRWTAVDLEHRRVTIDQAIVTGVDGLIEKDTKTHSARRVALDATTAGALAEHRGRQEERATQVGVRLQPDAFVFSWDPLGAEPWRPESVSRSFRLLCTNLGLTDVRLHDLRHYVATQLLAAGVDVRTVAGRLGHRNPSTTLNVYAHFVPTADAHAADVLAALLEHDDDPPTNERA
ncbi:MAG: tyrosine-type recombinase/integrase [Acidimicrobiia bacterium]